jgi:hypothetical protein
MTEEQYLRYLAAEAEYLEAEVARLKRERAPYDYMQMHVIDFGNIWQNVATTDPIRWPLINVASLQPKRAAHSTKVEWLHDSPVPVWAEGAHVGDAAKYRMRADFNYTHIFRVPWTEWVSNAVLASLRYGSSFPPPANGREKLKDMLDQIETQMRWGTRTQENFYRTAGSVEKLLGRWPRKDDFVQFAVLRDMQLRRYPNPKAMNSDRDAVSFQYEYLIELSWIAYRK